MQLQRFPLAILSLSRSAVEFCLFGLLASNVWAASPDIVISQVYGGGGNSSAPYTNDFIELFNRGALPVSLNGWSVQYASSMGSNWQVTTLPNVTLQAGRYFLIQEAGGVNGVALPTPDVIGEINMSSTGGKITLVDGTDALAGACPALNVLDLVGYGVSSNCFEGSAAPAPSNTKAVLRGDDGCTDTDDNSSDFTADTPTPRNTGTTANLCSLEQVFADGFESEGVP